MAVLVLLVLVLLINVKLGLLLHILWPMVGEADKPLQPLKSRFISLHVNPNNSRDLVLEFEKDFIDDPERMVLLSAVFNFGTVVGHTGRLSIANFPVADDIVLQFSRAPDGRTIDVRRVYMNVRTSDKESRLGMDRGYWTGRAISLPVVRRPRLWTPRVSASWTSKFFEKHNRGTSLEGASAYVDAFPLLNSGFFLLPPTVESFRLRLKDTKVFPHNIRVAAEFMLANSEGDSSPKTRRPFDLTIALTLLPKKPRVLGRAADDRVGYFASSYVDIGDHSNLAGPLCGQAGRVPSAAIPPSDPTRWSASAFRGSEGDEVVTTRRLKECTVRLADLVDRPVSIIHRRFVDINGTHPIVYYIDLSVPEHWRSSLARGVNLWDTAFAALGYPPRSIRAILPGDRDWPEDFAVGDVRYNSISWTADTVTTMALGPSVVDPRSGEVLSSSIVFTSGWVGTWLKELDIASPNLLAHVPGHAMDTKLSDDATRDIRSSEMFEPQVSPIDEPIEDYFAKLVFKARHYSKRLGAEVPDESLIRRFFRIARDQAKESQSDTDMKLPFGRVWDSSLGRVSLQQRSLDVASLPLPPEEVSLLGHVLRASGHGRRLKEGGELWGFTEATMKEGLMGVALHEVGHTLGLRHNFKASVDTPWSQLGNISFLREHGLGSSAMDYTAVNLPSAALEEYLSPRQGGAPPRLLFTPSIGGYDRLAIKYGYVPIHGEAEGVPHPELQKVAEEVASRFSFGTDEDDPSAAGADPTNNVYDLSDPLEFYVDRLRAIGVLRRGLRERSVREGESFDRLGKAERSLLMQILRTSTYLVKFVGGTILNKRPHTVGGSPPLAFETTDRQRKALEAILDIVGPRENSMLFSGVDTTVYEVERAGKFSAEKSYGLKPLGLWSDVRHLQRLTLLNLLLPSRAQRVEMTAAYDQQKEGADQRLSLAETMRMVGERLVPSGHELRVSASSLVPFWVFLSIAAAKGVAGDFSRSAGAVECERLLTVFKNLTSGDSLGRLMLRRLENIWIKGERESE